MNHLLHDSFSKIHQILEMKSGISLSELLLIAPIVKIEELAPGDFFLRAGESSQKVAFTLKGLAKTFYILDNSKELISDFGNEGSFLGVYTDMLKNVPSTGYIQAIEACTLLVMNYQEMLAITKDSLAWANLRCAMAEERYIRRSEKDRNITLKTAQEKYEYFNETHPELVDRLPQNQIALYLNINAATLSRLKNSSGNYKK